MKSAPQCEIEVLFGSAARGDVDNLSDIDILIVDDDPQRLRIRKKWLTTSGLSVSDYSWRRLVRLFEQRTLFSVHLKLESKLLHDQLGRYRDLLSLAQPATSYTKALNDSLLLFSGIESVPDSDTGRLWALDHLAVAFRNSAILLLANDGRFVFSYSDLLDELCLRGKLDIQEASVLRTLRHAKRRHRSGQVAPIARTAVTSAMRAVDRVFHLGMHTSFEKGICISKDLTPETSTQAYLHFRMIEKELLSAPILQEPEAAFEKQAMLHRVRAPHDYLWWGLYGSEGIRSSLRRIRAAY